MSDTPVQPTVGVGAEETDFGTKGVIDRYFDISSRGSTQRREIIAGVTTFLAMVYSVFVVPGMFGKAGFDTSAVFVAVCLTTAFGSLLMGLWAKLPIAIGCAISLTAFTAFGLVLGRAVADGRARRRVPDGPRVHRHFRHRRAFVDPAQPARGRRARHRDRHRPVPAADRVERRRPRDQEPGRRPAGLARPDHRVPGHHVDHRPRRDLRPRSVACRAASCSS